MFGVYVGYGIVVWVGFWFVFVFVLFVVGLFGVGCECVLLCCV